MNTIEITRAIKFLRPNAQFSFENADYATIKWDVLEGEAPTLQQLQEAHQTIQQQKEQAEAEAQAKRTLALAKLAALGLDEDDLKALGL